MEPEVRFSVRSRIRSFGFAIAGIRTFIRREHNARIHLAATVAVIIAAIVARVSVAEAGALTIVVALVWITEILNTCIERMADLITPDQDPQIKFIKDIAAAAVLIAAITAVVTGLLIFIPKIL
ncbi:MAG: diacylglycerol kinase family protein [Bacteroidetes bacterium]|nr:diacylglycerol kinase family protein [Bacteroidota bacterium]